MIDIDKYTGHTPAPWKNVAGDIYANNEHIADTVLEQVIPQDEAYANTFLIADAPLLLEEVKRLREQNKLMVDYFRYMRDGGFTDADWRTVNEWIGDEEE